MAVRGNMGASVQDKINVRQGHETTRQQSEARRVPSSPAGASVFQQGT